MGSRSFRFCVRPMILKPTRTPEAVTAHCTGLRATRAARTRLRAGSVSSGFAPSTQCLPSALALDHTDGPFPSSARIHTVHNYRQVCASGIYFRDGHTCTECRGRAFGFPAIRHSCYRGSTTQSAVMAATLAAHRGTWRSVEHFIALNLDIAAHLESFGIPRPRITVKPNAAPDPGDHAEIGSGFLFAGLLAEEKGVRLLLDAWQRHPPESIGKLRFAGDGPLRELVECTAAERTDVVYLGLLGSKELRAAMRAAAVFVAPSTCADVAPMVVTEALANARPVLGTALGGIPFLIGADHTPGSNSAPGWLSGPTVGALAAMLPRARLEAAALTGIARNRYLTALHPDILTARLIEIYSDVTRLNRV